MLFVSVHIFFNTLGMLLDYLFILIYSFYIITVGEFLSSVELLNIFKYIYAFLKRIHYHISYVLTVTLLMQLRCLDVLM